MRSLQSTIHTPGNRAATSTIQTVSIRKSALALTIATTFLLITGPGAASAFAQASGGGAPAAPATGAPGTSTTGVASQDYKIAADDQIDVSIVDHPEDSRTYQVPPDGIIQPPVGGDIKVIGMTVDQLRTALTAAWSKRLYKPSVIVNVHPAAQTVNVTGAIHGTKLPIKAGARVLDVIAAAGGLPTDRPEAYKATLFRTSAQDVQTFPIDLLKLYHNDPTQNLVVENGDTLYVEEKASTETDVQVIGEVMKPGAVLLPRDHSIVTVLQEVGGPTPLALLSGVIVDRDGQQTKIDMRNYRLNGFEPTQKLEGGDKLIVPENKSQYYVIGAAPKTGTQVYPDDKPLTVFTAVEAAGGTTEGVDLSKVQLIHPLPNGKDKLTVVNVQKMYKTGDFSQNMPVEPGDTLFIPPSSSSHGLSLSQILTIFGGLAGVITLIELLK